MKHGTLLLNFSHRMTYQMGNIKQHIKELREHLIGRMLVRLMPGMRSLSIGQDMMLCLEPYRSTETPSQETFMCLRKLIQHTLLFSSLKTRANTLNFKPWNT